MPAQRYIRAVCYGEVCGWMMTQLWWDRIANNDESDYRQEVEHLEGWCRKNNLCINVKKTKEMIVDFRRGRHLPSPLYIGGTVVEVVSSFRYLGVHISDDLTWSNNTSCLIRKAHQRLYFLRRLRRAGLGSSVLTSFLQMCGGECPVLLHHHVARQLLGGREEGSAEGGEGCTEDCRRLRSIKSRTTRLRNSFFPEAVRLSNSGGHHRTGKGPGLAKRTEAGRVQLTHEISTTFLAEVTAIIKRLSS
ncbi:hypothetical protein L3Q82_020593, partial [Scortum barcoo]